MQFDSNAINLKETFSVLSNEHFSGSGGFVPVTLPLRPLPNNQHYTPLSSTIILLHTPTLPPVTTSSPSR